MATSIQRMQTIPIRYIPKVGAIFQRLSGGWNWSHCDGTNSMADAIPGQNAFEHRAADGHWVIEHYESDGEPADFYTERDALASLLAYHFTAESAELDISGQAEVVA